MTLTKIVQGLAKQQRSRPSKERTLENLLDGCDSGATADFAPAGSSSGARSKTAAWRFLRESLKRRPEQVYRSVEALMEEDLLNRRAGGPSHPRPPVLVCG